jgi:hypothetical protein
MAAPTEAKGLATALDAIDGGRSGVNKGEGAETLEDDARAER